MKKIFNYIYIFLFCVCLIGCRKENIEKSPIYEEDLKVYFINVGQADSTFIILPTGENILIDAGLDNASCFGENEFPSWDNIKKVFALENVSTINNIIITHSHSDHYYFVADIIRQYNVEKIYLSGSTSTNYTYLDLLETIDEYNVATYETYMGQKIIDMEGLELQVLYSIKKDNPEDANICSVITKLVYDEISFLFMGDGGSKDNDVEPALLQMNVDLSADVLKVGHHGSMYASSEAFLEKVKPTYAIITTAKVTTTGHPHRSALERIMKYSEKVFQSKSEGTILFVSDGINLKSYIHIGE